MKTLAPVIVTLRTRKTSSGKDTLYLDITEFGNRRKEALHMSLMPGKDKESKLRNQETMRIAQLKARSREDELNSYADGYDRDGFGLDMEFFPYYCSLIEKKESERTKANWRNTLIHLQRYERNEHITFRHITPRWVMGFRDYLTQSAEPIVYKERGQEVEVDESGRYHRIRKYNGEKRRLATNTARSYFLAFVCCINTAKEEHLLKKNPCDDIKRIEKAETNREHLTIEEFKTLSATPYRDNQLRRAFLFACMTGLRFSDIRKLTWREIRDESGMSFVTTTMKKTKKDIRIPINNTALGILGDRGESEELVFKGLSDSGHINEQLSFWVKSAGIDKYITFHCSRHTFACLTLIASGDLYTTSKLLGHTDIKVTQVYAKVLDDSKVKAMNALNNLL